MNYGGTNDILDPNSTVSRARFPNGGERSPYNGKCPVCNESCDKHIPFPFISSDEYTETLAKKLQDLLGDVIKDGHTRGFDPSRTSCMVGAARATINNGVSTYVTISGGNMDILNKIKDRLGKNVQIVKTPSATPLRIIANKEISLVPKSWNRNRDYPVGSCAAQKLLMAVFTQAKRSGGLDKISKLNMAEILWCDPSGNGHNRDWSTGQIVESCDTCKQILPAMLCHVSD